MKCASIVVLGCVGAIAVLPPAFSQSSEMSSVLEPQKQSELLVTQPLTIERSPVEQHGSSLDPDKLSHVASSIQANPARKDGSDSVLPSNLIPKDLFHVPSNSLPESHPLEVFQPPAPNRSFGINLNRL